MKIRHIAGIALALLLAACGVIDVEPVEINGVRDGTPFRVAIGQPGTAAPTQQPTDTPTPPPTNTPRPTDAPTGEPSATHTATPSPTWTPSATPTPTNTPTTPAPSATPTNTPPGEGDVWDHNVTSFDAAQLPDNQRGHYAAFLSALWDSDRQYPDLDSAAASGDLYRCARTLNTGVTAALTTFRVTGDAQVLAEVVRLMDLVAGNVSDHNGDGYRDLVWMAPYADPSHYWWGRDDHSMDSALCHSLIVAYTWALVEADVYTDRAAFWIDYLFNDYIPRWGDKEGSYNALPFKDLAHPYTAIIRLHYYVGRLAAHSGRDASLWNMGARELMEHTIEQLFRPEADFYYWDHRVPGYGHQPYGCQGTEYAALTMISAVDLAAEGFSLPAAALEWAGFGSDVYMQPFANTWRDRVLGGESLTSVANNVCGLGSERATKYVISFAPLVAMWDPTGYMVARSAALLRNTPYTANITVPAGAFLHAVTNGQGLRPGEHAASFGVLPGRGGGATPLPTATYDSAAYPLFVRVYDTAGHYTEFVRADTVVTPPPDATNAATAQPTPTPEEAPPLGEPTPPDAALYAYVIAPRGINVREGPSLYSVIAGGLPFHACVEIEANLQTWLRIGTGFITADPRWVEEVAACPAVRRRPVATQTPAYSGGGHAVPGVGG
jgi:hypothetical protein